MKTPARTARWVALAVLAGVATSAEQPGGVVSAATPEAVAAGVRILEKGGNAVDAAVAVSFAVAVSEPAGSGLLGQSLLLVHPGDGEPFVIQAPSRAPGTVPPDTERSDLVGRRAATVPSTVRAMEFAWRRHGSGRLAWSELIQPAIEVAEDGYVLGSFRHRALARYADQIRRDPAAAHLLLGPDGSVPQEGARVRSPTLARTLRRLARAGARDLYEGGLAGEIAEDMTRAGGWITQGDLRAFPEPVEAAPLVGTYRGYDVYSLPPPAGGWVVLMALNLLELAPPVQLANPVTRRVWLGEALRLAHGERAARPVRDVRSYAEDVAAKIDKDRARELAAVLDEGGETTHFSIVDAEGMAVSVTQSLNAYFGARVAHPELGLLYNDYMRELVTGRPGHPYALRPEALPYSSMSATIVARSGRPVLALGSPGSARIISAVVQVISHWLDLGDGIAAAVGADRLHPSGSTLLIERDNLAVDELRALENRGFRIQRQLSSFGVRGLDAYFGGVHAVALENGSWTGAADPRRDGAVGLALRR